MIKEIIEKNIKKVLEKESAKLGDRLKYIGASDVGGCPRKTVLSKIDPPEMDVPTLIRLQRGHLAELILKECFEFTNYRWEPQKELVHPDYDYLRAHIDFFFYTADYSKIGIVEQKSVSLIPSEPYANWIDQLQFQLGLAKLVYPKAEIKGSLFVIDLNSGQYEEFNGMTPDDNIFSILVDKAKQLYEMVQRRELENLPVEIGPECSYCPFKATCPAFSGDDPVVSEDTKKLVKEYVDLSAQEKEIKGRKDSLKNEIINQVGTNFKAGFEGHKLFVKEMSSVRVDERALKENYPEIYEVVQKTVSYISFRVY